MINDKWWGASHVEIWAMSGPGRGEGKCKGPEAGLCLAQLRTESTGRMENKGGEVQILRDLVATLRTLSWTLGEAGARTGEHRRDKAQFPFNWT